MADLVLEVVKIAQDAGAEIMKIYADESQFGIEHKADSSPLTKADQRANEVICAGLEKLDQHYPIISEENKTVSYHDRKGYDRYWLVDPLDGTKEFIKRNDEFTVNIALIENGMPIMGIVYVPVMGTSYYAEKGKGAWKLEGGLPQKLSVKNFKKTDPNLRVVCSRSHLNEQTAAFVEKLTSPQLVSKGSSLKFLIIAEGGAELYPRLAPTMEWDTGAAQAILEEAGGQVVQHANGKPVEYNKEDLLNPWFIAAGNGDFDLAS